jgi:hypothetical protein
VQARSKPAPTAIARRPQLAKAEVRTLTAPLTSIQPAPPRQPLPEYQPAGRGAKRAQHEAKLTQYVQRLKRVRASREQELAVVVRQSMRELRQRIEYYERMTKRKRRIEQLTAEAKASAKPRPAIKPMSEVQLAASQRLLELKQGALGDSQERERAKRRKKAAPTAEAEVRQTAKARVRAGKGRSGVRAIGRRLALK